MSAEIDHWVFEQPKNKNIKAWRYMDFTKYVWMLSNSSLYFSRADYFDDPYEGATSQVNIESRDKFLKGLPKKEKEKISGFNKNTRQWVYINCWHMNKYESTAMWKLYSKTNEAIAIQSTYKKLHNCLPPKVYLGKVNYIDYDNEPMPEGNSLWPFVHKRKSFSHERELRAIIPELFTDDNQITIGNENEKKGELIEINFESLVENIFVSPDAPSWFQTLVKEVTNKFEKNVDILQSKLGNDPLF